ncbi:MAG: hypothetical protein ACR2PW_08820 [Gammaproteobacteria bacterium]
MSTSIKLVSYLLFAFVGVMASARAANVYQMHLMQEALEDLRAERHQLVLQQDQLRFEEWALINPLVLDQVANDLQLVENRKILRPLSLVNPRHRRTSNADYLDNHQQ